MLVSIVLVAVCFASSTVVTASGLDKPYYDLKEAENLFRDFVKHYEKAYDRREYFERLEIFKETLKDINMRNEKYPMTVFKVNHFADLKPKEMAQYKGLKLSNETTTNKVTIPKSPIPAPNEFDWRKKDAVSHVKDQLHCGSCYIFSAIGNIEGQHSIKHKECLALSEGQALDCLKCGSCDGGIMHTVFEELSKKAGVMKEEDYHYIPMKRDCKEDANKVAVKVLGGKVLKIPDEDTLMDALLQFGPLAVAMNADDMSYYNGGILIPNYCNFDYPNHAVLLVGYGEENRTKFWIIKNSWGTKWGEAGYLRLLRGVNACKMGTCYTATSTVA